MAPWAALRMVGSDRLAEETVLVPGDVATTRITEIEDRLGSRLVLWPAEITLKESADVFGEGDPELCRPFAPAPLNLGGEGNLGPCHHDGCIIAQPQFSPSSSVLYPGNSDGLEGNCLTQRRRETKARRM